MLEPRYRKPFLKDAILRVDFSSPARIDKDYVEKTIVPLVAGRYPLLEPEESIATEFQLGPDAAAVAKQTRQTAWNMLGPDRDDRRLSIGQNHLFATHPQYTSWTVLKEDFLLAFDQVVHDNKDIQVSRLGVRYIDVITLKETKPFDWGKYLAPELTCSLAFSKSPERLTRSMQVIEMAYSDDVRVKFQFGMPNLDYPAPIREKTFVLDVDASVQRLLSPSEVRELLDPVHGHVKRLFEDSILDGLRALMEPISDGR